MDYEGTLPARGRSRKAMMKRVGASSHLKGTDGGLPASELPGCRSILYKVWLSRPGVHEDRQAAQVGDIRAPRGDQISEGFHWLCRALPGKGPLRCCKHAIPNRTFIARPAPGRGEAGRRTGQARARGT